MDWLGLLVWGFWAIAAMTSIEAAARWLNLTRMSTPVLLGSAVSSDRDRATLWGTLIHAGFGWTFAALYALGFLAAGSSDWWIGLLMGLGQAVFMYAVIFPALPAIHPHMASTREPPGPHDALQPPGFLALNYGRNTIIVVLVSHAVYGTLFALLYDVPS